MNDLAMIKAKGMPQLFKPLTNCLKKDLLDFYQMPPVTK